MNPIIYIIEHFSMSVRFYRKAYTKNALPIDFL